MNTKIVFFVSFLYALSHNAAVHAEPYTNALHQSMWATFLHHDQQHEHAHHWWDKTVDNNPTSLYVLKGYLPFLQSIGNYKKIVSYIKPYQKKYKNDPKIQAIFAHALAHVGRTKEATKLFLKLNKQFPTDSNIAFEAVQTLARQNKIDQALQVAETIVHKEPHKQGNFIFYFLQAQLYTQQRNIPQARKALDHCLQLHPRFGKGLLLRALLDQQEGAITNTQHGYTALTQKNKTGTAQVQQNMLALALQQTAGGMRKPLLAQKASLDAAVALLKQKKYKTALKHANTCINDAPHDPRPKLLKIQILTDMGKQDTALQTVVEWIKSEPHQQIWFSTLHLLLRAQVPAQKLIATLEDLHATHTESHWPSLYLADIYMRTNQYDNALQHLAHAITQTDDASLLAELYFEQAVINYEQNNMDGAHHALDKGLACHVAYAPLFNLAAYYYATKGKNVDKAEKLLAQALLLSPTNPHFIDTKAMIAYKKGNYQEAKELLAPYAQSDDATILLNLAKIEYKLEHTHAAHSLLQKAKKYAHHKHEHNHIAKLTHKWLLA